METLEGMAEEDVANVLRGLQPHQSAPLLALVSPSVRMCPRVCVLGRPLSLLPCLCLLFSYLTFSNASLHALVRACVLFSPFSLSAPQPLSLQMAMRQRIKIMGEMTVATAGKSLNAMSPVSPRSSTKLTLSALARVCLAFDVLRGALAGWRVGR